MQIMKRRNFIKTVLFSMPALYLEPLSLFNCSEVIEISNNYKIRDNRNQDLIIFFIGRYGEKVFEEFQRLRLANPILHKCKHIDMDVNSNDGFIIVSEKDNMLDIIARCCNCKFAAFIMNSNSPADTVLVETITLILRRSGDKGIFCLTPLLKKEVDYINFDLVFETCTNGFDMTSSVLLTIYNTALGCGRMGNLMCFKLLYSDIKDREYNRAKVGIAYRKQRINKINPYEIVLDACQGTGYEEKNGCDYGLIFEVHDFNCHRILDIYTEILDMFSEISGCDFLSMVHAGLTETKVKLTVFRLYNDRRKVLKFDKSIGNVDIPLDSGHPFRSIPATHSGTNRPPCNTE